MTTTEKGCECYSLMVKTSKNLGVLRKDTIYSVASFFFFFSDAMFFLYVWMGSKCFHIGTFFIPNDTSWCG